MYPQNLRLCDDLSIYQNRLLIPNTIIRNCEIKKSSAGIDFNCQLHQQLTIHQFFFETATNYFFSIIEFYVLNLM